MLSRALSPPTPIPGKKHFWISTPASEDQTADCLASDGKEEDSVCGTESGQIGIQDGEGFVHLEPALGEKGMLLIASPQVQSFLALEYVTST